MSESSLIALFVRPLNDRNIPYLITGGVASIIYGEPRLTRDIDLVIDLHPRDAKTISATWPTDQFYVPPVEVLEAEAGRAEGGHFNISHHDTGLRADCYVVGADPLHAWAFERPHLERLDTDDIRVAPIEYVILRKLSYFQQGRSDRHLRDVANMLRIRGDLIDQAALNSWLERLRLKEEWRRATDLSQHEKPY